MQRLAGVAYKVKEIGEDLDGLGVLLGGVRERLLAEAAARQRDADRGTWQAAATLGRSVGLLALRYVLAIVLMVVTAAHYALDVAFLRQRSEVRVAVAFFVTASTLKIVPCHHKLKCFAPINSYRRLLAVVKKGRDFYYLSNKL